MHKVLKQRPFQFGGYAITSPSIIGIESSRVCRTTLEKREELHYIVATISRSFALSAADESAWRSRVRLCLFVASGLTHFGNGGTKWNTRQR
jgi:hypothetical protein